MHCDFVTVHFVVFKCDVRAHLTRCGNLPQFSQGDGVTLHLRKGDSDPVAVDVLAVTLADVHPPTTTVYAVEVGQHPNSSDDSVTGFEASFEVVTGTLMSLRMFGGAYTLRRTAFCTFDFLNNVYMSNQNPGCICACMGGWVGWSRPIEITQRSGAAM